MGGMGDGRSEHGEPDHRADRARHDEADSREVEADRRERGIDARERVLDRWEQEIATRAAELNLLDELDEEERQRARVRRASERGQRRDDAETRRDAAIERDIRQARRVDQANGVYGTAPRALPGVALPGSAALTAAL